MAKQQKRHVETCLESMQRHVLNHNKPTYPNIPDVEKNSNATSKQTPKNNANTKHNPTQTQTCGKLESPTAHKEKRTPINKNTKPTHKNPKKTKNLPKNNPFHQKTPKTPKDCT